MKPSTINELINKQVKKYSNKLLYQKRDGWSWKQITWLDFDSEIKSIASFFFEEGLNPEDKSLIISPNTLECFYFTLALNSLGVSNIFSTEYEEFKNNIETISKLKPKLIILDKYEGLESISNQLEELDFIKKIIILDDPQKSADKRVVSYKFVVKIGFLKLKKIKDELNTRADQINPDSISGIFLKSNGKSKSDIVEWSHKKILNSLESNSEKLKFMTIEDQSYSCLLYSTPFDKLVNLITLYNGCRSAIAESYSDFYRDIRELKPTILYDSKNGIENKISEIKSRTDHDLDPKSLKISLGNRIKHLVTDIKPNKYTNDILSEAGIEIIELPELMIN